MTSNELGKLWAYDRLSDSQRSFILNDAIYYEIAHALGVPPHDRSNLALCEAVNFSRMGHARGLLDFFEHSRADNKEPKPDDVLSEDFGFAARAVPLLESDRFRFNKDLFHSTFSRCRHLEPGAVKEWPPAILGPIHGRCLEFVDFVVSGRMRKGIGVETARWQDMSDVLRSGCEIVLAYAPDGAGNFIWRVSIGRSHLDGGLSRLTSCEVPQCEGVHSTSGNAVPIVLRSECRPNVAISQISVSTIKMS